MSGPVFGVVETIERQADSCARIGSPLYARLLRDLAADHRSGGLTAELLDGVSERPLHDALALRYLATAHRLALTGAAPTLAAQYPSCGGSWDGGDLAGAFLAVVAEHRDEFEAGVRRNVQTNEVGRAAVLASGFSVVAERTGWPLRTLEIGASAGLLSRWPRYGYHTGESTTGDLASPLQFGPSWWTAPLPALHPGTAVVERAASDVAPIDLATDDGRATLLSFLWPDQADRLERTRAALRVAADDPLTVERADAGEWLTRRLATPGPAGTATVVFHAIVWQYLPEATRSTLREALTSAGAAATADAPLLWLRMEPATAEHADLRLTSWPGGHEEVLAEVGYHGAAIRWQHR